MLNHIDIMGRLVRDPEVRTTGSGLTVTRFTVAVERDYKGQSGQKETDFIDCVAWRQTGEFAARYLRKGSMAAVSGRLESSTWTDKDGNKHKSWEVSANSIYFGESRKAQDSGFRSREEAPPAWQTEQQSFPVIAGDDEQLPF